MLSFSSFIHCNLFHDRCAQVHQDDDVSLLNNGDLALMALITGNGYVRTFHLKRLFDRRLVSALPRVSE